MEEMLATFPREPLPGARRRLASVMLAAGEGISAYVQWLRLPVAERREGDGLNEALVKQLAAIGERRNESIQVGARPAARVGLERVLRDGRPHVRCGAKRGPRLCRGDP